MAKDKPSPFRKNPFNKSDELVLVKVPEAPETHEPRKSLRSYLAPRAGGDLSELAAALGGGRRPKKIIEHVRDASPPDDNDGEFAPPPTPSGR
ncbi:MAG: hypothetical protein WC869_00960 [Phycisphaerae bacterium]|jgi:hypothetical protein